MAGAPIPECIGGDPGDDCLGLHVEGGVLPGSLAPVTGIDYKGLGPDYPVLCAPGEFAAPYGPVGDVLLTNTTSCSQAVLIGIQAAPALTILNPGASVVIGFVIGTDGVNQPPKVLDGTDLRNAGHFQRNDSAVTTCQSVVPNPTFIPRFTGLVLAPGDFVWLSVQNTLYIDNAGPQTSVNFLDGEGTFLTLTGVQV